MAVTIVDIAERIGTSKMTVSRALRGVEGISESTRRRVLAAATEMGYRTNTAARAITTGRFGQIAMVLGRGATVSTLSKQLQAALIDELAATGQHLVFSTLADEQLTDPAALPRLMREWLADGMLFNYTHCRPTAFRDVVEELGLPTVWLNVDLDHDCVHPDDLAAGATLTEHLIARGCRRIVYIDYSHPADELHQSHYSARRRAAGYERAMHAAGLQGSIIRPTARLNHAGTFEDLAARDWSALSGPDAIIGYSTSALINEVGPLLCQHGRLPMRDVLFASFADVPEWYMGQPVPTMEVPNLEIARAAAAMINRKIADPLAFIPSEAVPFRLVTDGMPRIERSGPQD